MATLEIPRESGTEPPKSPRELAIEALDLIASASSPKDEVFFDPQLGRYFAEIVGADGEVSVGTAGLPRSAGYQQLHRDSGQERLLATLYPAKGEGESSRLATFHGVISSHHKTVAVTIPVNTGESRTDGLRPLVRISREREYGRVDIGADLDPPQANAVVRRLARLMLSNLGSQEELEAA